MQTTQHDQHHPDHLALDAALIPQDDAAIIRTLTEEAADLDAQIVAAQLTVKSAEDNYDRHIAGGVCHPSTHAYISYANAAAVLTSARVALNRLIAKRTAANRTLARLES